MFGALGIGTVDCVVIRVRIMPRKPELRPAPAAGGQGFTANRLSMDVLSPQALLFNSNERRACDNASVILLAIATPSFTAVINGNRLASGANETVASLQLARSEAIKRNQSVAVCRSADGATCVTTSDASWLGWITVVDSTGELIRTHAVKLPVQVAASNAIANSVDRVIFRADGMARTAAGILLNAQFSVCIPTSLPAENQRLVSIGAGSRISVDRVNAAGACLQPGDS